jgi:toxin FitB
VSRSLLDTNIISNVTKPVPSEALVAWMAKQADDDLFISSLTVAEIRRGILEKPAGKKRRELERWFTGPDGPQSLFAGRVLPFDEKAGLVWARLMADGRAKGRPRNPLDMIVAAVAEANNCLVVTENERHFAGLKMVNPLRANRPAVRNARLALSACDDRFNGLRLNSVS